MGLYRLLRSVGFEHQDIAGGLLAEHPAIRLNERRERLENRIRKVYGRLVRHRQALEEFKTRQSQKQQISDRMAMRLRHYEQAYDYHLQLLARLKQKLKVLRAQAAW